MILNLWTSKLVGDGFISEIEDGRKKGALPIQADEHSAFQIAESLASELPNRLFYDTAHIKPKVKTHVGKQSKKFQIIPWLDRIGSVDMDIRPI